ncbi:MAG: hypothetical protein ABSH39_18310 [Candidatus Acidiferrum sp.]|jgi:hypothetical protein
MSRCILAVALSFFLSGALPTQTTQTAPASVVLQTNAAKVNAVDAAAGSTVFDGDRLETQSKGMLSLRSGEIQFTLPEESTLWMNHEGLNATPRLQRGTVVFRAENGVGVEIIADDVRVRPHFPVLTVGQVTLEECYVIVTARTQSLDVTAGKETKNLEEGKSVRVARAGVCGAAINQPVAAVGQSRFFILPVAAAVAIGILVLHKGLESPDRP